MVVRVAIRETLADRIPSTHASRSSSLAVEASQSRSSEDQCNRHSHAYKAKEEWGL